MNITAYNYLNTFSINDHPCDAPNCLFNDSISLVIIMDSAISSSLGDTHLFCAVTKWDKSTTASQHLSHTAKCDWIAELLFGFRCSSSLHYIVVVPI